MEPPRAIRKKPTPIPGTGTVTRDAVAIDMTKIVQMHALNQMARRAQPRSLVTNLSRAQAEDQNKTVPIPSSAIPQKEKIVYVPVAGPVQIVEKFVRGPERIVERFVQGPERVVQK